MKKTIIATVVFEFVVDTDVVDLANVDGGRCFIDGTVELLGLCDIGGRPVYPYSEEHATTNIEVVDGRIGYGVD